MDAKLIGIISKATGIKGEVTVRLLTDYPRTIKKGDILFFDEKCIRKAEVENIRFARSRKSELFAVIKFRGTDSRDHAEKLRNTKIFRREENSPSPGENQYWTDDIIGCKVYSKENIFIGLVVDVEKFAANDNLVVRIENKDLNIEVSGSNLLYIPVIKDYIYSITPREKKVILKRIPEYI